MASSKAATQSGTSMNSTSQSRTPRPRALRAFHKTVLKRAGYLPVTFDNFERGHQWAVKWGPLERGDLRDENDLRRAFETQASEREPPCQTIHRVR